MASKRELKKSINSMIYDVVDECYSLQLFDESKKKKTDEFIDEAANFQDEITSAIRQAKTKKDFKAINDKFHKANEEWRVRLNKLQ